MEKGVSVRSLFYSSKHLCVVTAVTLQETEIAVGGQCCRCAQELRCGQVRAARSVISPVYWATTTPRYGKSRVLGFN